MSFVLTLLTYFLITYRSRIRISWLHMLLTSKTSLTQSLTLWLQKEMQSESICPRQLFVRVLCCLVQYHSILHSYKIRERHHKHLLFFRIMLQQDDNNGCSYFAVVTTQHIIKTLAPYSTYVLKDYKLLIIVCFVKHDMISMFKWMIHEKGLMTGQKLL